MKTQSIIEPWLRAFLPLPCPICRKEPESTIEGNTICQDCLKQIPFVVPPYCPGCGATLDSILNLCTECLQQPVRPWIHAIALCSHRDPIQNLIHQFKYRDASYLARPFAALAVRRLPELPWTPDLITSIPLHWSRFLWRGYNQSTELAKEIQNRTQIPFKILLKKNHQTAKQASLHREERMKNLQHAFSIKSKSQICNKKILLIDDVFTTGATLTAATQILLDAGAQAVAILVISRR